MNLSASDKVFALSCLMCVPAIALGKHKAILGLLAALAGVVLLAFAVKLRKRI